MLNNGQIERIKGHLEYNERCLKSFYNQKNSLATILEIYKSIINPSYLAEGRSEPLCFSSFNDISWRNKNKSDLLPLTNLKTIPAVHEAAYSI